MSYSQKLFPIEKSFLFQTLAFEQFIAYSFISLSEKKNNIAEIEDCHGVLLGDEDKLF